MVKYRRTRALSILNAGKTKSILALSVQMSPVVYVTSNSLNMLKHSEQKGPANFYVSKNAFTEKVKKKRTQKETNE